MIVLPRRFALHRLGGGLPVIVDAALVGAVAVSGLPEQEDITLAQIGVDAILAGMRR